MHIWFTWDIKIVVTDYLTFVMGLFYFLIAKKKLKFSPQILTIYFLYLIATAWNTIQTISTFAWIFHPTFLLLMMMENNEQQIILRRWTNIYAWILSVSLIAWIVSWTGELPSYGEVCFANVPGYTYTNYLFCIRGFLYGPRFNSVFLEPGHTAMIGALTLAANRFEFKRTSMYIIMFCSIFTLSLAGIFLIFIGIVLNKLFVSGQWQKLLKVCLLLFPIFVGIYFFTINYNNGNNIVNDLFFERIAYDEDKGISGNNRTYEQTDVYFERFLESSDLLTGVDMSEWIRGIEDESIKGAGYKLYLIQFGLIGTFFMFLVFMMIYLYSYDKKMMFILFLIHIFAFLQRSYPFWESWIFLFYLPSKQQIDGNIVKSKLLRLSKVKT